MSLFTRPTMSAVLLFVVLTTASQSGGAQPSATALTKVRLGVGNAALPPALAHFTSIPRILGYWNQEGLDVQVVVLDGSLALEQALAVDKIDVGMDATSAMMASIQAGSDPIAYYTEATRNFWLTVVPQNSPIKDLADMRGKRLGVPSLESAVVPINRALLSSVGLAPSDYQIIAVGFGADAYAALQAGRIDALGSFDLAVAAVAAQGIALRELSSPLSKDLGFMQALVTRKRALSSKRDVLVRLARGIAKGIVFAKTNPEAAARLHWAVYPETKPTGVSDSDALARAVRSMNARLANIEPVNGSYGEATSKQIEQYIAVLVQAQLLKAPLTIDQVWTGVLVKDANTFDQNAIVQQAKSCQPSANGCR